MVIYRFLLDYKASYIYKDSDKNTVYQVFNINILAINLT